MINLLYPTFVRLACRGGLADSSKQYRNVCWMNEEASAACGTPCVHALRAHGPGACA